MQRTPIQNLQYHPEYTYVIGNKWFFIVKTFMLGFIGVFHEKTDEINLRLNPTVFFLASLNTYGFFHITEAIFKRHLFQTYAFLFIIVWEEIIAILLPIIVAGTDVSIDEDSNSRDYTFAIFIVSILFACTILLQLLYNIYVFRKCTEAFSLSTYKVVGPSADILEAYKYKQQLFILGRINVLNANAGLIATFGTTDSSLRNILFYMVQFAARVVLILTIFIMPYDDVPCIKYANMSSCVFLIIWAVIVFIVGLVVVDEKIYIILADLVIIRGSTVVVVAVTLYLSVMDYKYFGSGIKSQMKLKENKKLKHKEHTD